MQRVQVGGDVARIALGDAEFQHGAAGGDLLGVHDPGHHVVRRVREHACEVGTIGDPDKGRADLALGAVNARNGVAGTAAVLGDPLPAALEAMRAAAEQGMTGTIPLVARKGRASYLGERSAGHQDPGATSSYLLLKTAAETLTK